MECMLPCHFPPILLMPLPPLSLFFLKNIASENKGDEGGAPYNPQQPQQQQQQPGENAPTNNAFYSPRSSTRPNSSPDCPVN
eukprot:13919581-Ditylum_brightwellii.AAC.1